MLQVFFVLEDGPYFNYRVKTMLPLQVFFNIFADKAVFYSIELLFASFIF